MTQTFRSGCPIASSLDTIGDKWSLVILRSMVMGADSFARLLAQPEGIATNILADRLRRMSEAGLIFLATPKRGRTPGRYRLTKAGAALIPVMQALALWGEAHLPERWKSPAAFHAARPEAFA